MKLIAKKPCSFGGKQFYIGDEIPAKDVLNPTVQEKRGVLTCVSEEAHVSNGPDTFTKADTPPATVPIILNDAQGKLELNVTPAGLQSVFDVLTTKAKEAEAIVNTMTDNDVLILVCAADSRKTIQEAAETRAKQLIAENNPDEMQEGAGEE